MVRGEGEGGGERGREREEEEGEGEGGGKRGGRGRWEAERMHLFFLPSIFPSFLLPPSSQGSS